MISKLTTNYLGNNFYFISIKNSRFDTMFKYVFLSLIFSISGLQSYGQGGFKIGPSAYLARGGAIPADDLPFNYNTRYRAGFGGGITMRYGFTPFFSLSTGAFFVSKGYKMYNDTNKNGNVLKRNLSNIEIPLNFHFLIKRMSKTEARLVLGGTLCNNITASSKTLSNKNGSFIVKENFKNKIYPMLNAGLEFTKTDKVKNTMVFSFMYKYSLATANELSVFSSPNSTTRDFMSVQRGTYLGIGFTYLFDSRNFRKKEEFFY